MGRPPEHASGAKIHFALRLPPAHLLALDAYADSTGLTRSQAVGALIEQAKLVAVEPEPDNDVNVVQAVHSDRTPGSPFGLPQLSEARASVALDGDTHSLGGSCPHPMSKSVAKTGASSNVRRCGLCGHIGGPATFRSEL